MTAVVFLKLAYMLSRDPKKMKFLEGHDKVGLNGKKPGLGDLGHRSASTGSLIDDVDDGSEQLSFIQPLKPTPRRFEGNNYRTQNGKPHYVPYHLQDYNPYSVLSNLSVQDGPQANGSRPERPIPDWDSRFFEVFGNKLRLVGQNGALILSR